MPPPAAITSTVFAYPGVTPSVSSSGNSSGIIWAYENSSSGSGPAVLHAYDAVDLFELYNLLNRGVPSSTINLATIPIEWQIVD
jgi:hypothetical protein